MSKIIEKEKARKEELLENMNKAFNPGMFMSEERSKMLSLKNQHKQSLINLKEYMEEDYENMLCNFEDFGELNSDYCYKKLKTLKQDIKELTEMIK